MKKKYGKDEEDSDPVDVKMSVVHSFLNFEFSANQPFFCLNGVSIDREIPRPDQLIRGFQLDLRYPGYCFAEFRNSEGVSPVMLLKTLLKLAFEL